MPTPGRRHLLWHCGWGTRGKWRRLGVGVVGVQGMPTLKSLPVVVASGSGNPLKVATTEGAWEGRSGRGRPGREREAPGGGVGAGFGDGTRRGKRRRSVQGGGCVGDEARRSHAGRLRDEEQLAEAECRLARQLARECGVGDAGLLCDGSSRVTRGIDCVIHRLGRAPRLRSAHIDNSGVNTDNSQGYANITTDIVDAQNDP